MNKIIDLNILLENARIPPKETYVDKIIDLKSTAEELLKTHTAVLFV